MARKQTAQLGWCGRSLAVVARTVFRKTRITRAIALTGIFPARCDLRISARANLSRSRRWVWACLRDQQPPLGVGVLAGSAVLHRQPVRVQLVRDQVRAGPLHVRRAGR
jgi:hypothetical protein